MLVQMQNNIKNLMNFKGFVPCCHHNVIMSSLQTLIQSSFDSFMLCMCPCPIFPTAPAVQSLSSTGPTTQENLLFQQPATFNSTIPDSPLIPQLHDNTSE